MTHGVADIGVPSGTNWPRIETPPFAAALGIIVIVASAPLIVSRKHAMK